MKINDFANFGKTNPIKPNLSASLSIVLSIVALAKMEACLPSIALAKEGAKADFRKFKIFFRND